MDIDPNRQLLDAASGDLVGIRAALNAGADINTRDSWGMTPLMWATFSGHAAAVAELLKRGADPNLLCKEGTSALARAVASNHPKVAEMLLAGGAKPENELLARVIADRIRGAKPAQVVRSNQSLVLAAKTGKVDDVREALLGGAEVDCRDLSTHTPLMWAAYNGHQSAVDCLIQAGADVNAVDAEKKAAIDYGLEQKEWLGVAALVEAGAITPANFAGLVGESFPYFDSGIVSPKAFMAAILRNDIPEVLVRRANEVLYPCPACGYLAFVKPPGSYVHCSFCSWIDELEHLLFPDYVDTDVNGDHSLITYQLIFQDPEKRKLFGGRTPCAGDIRDTQWRVLDPQKDNYLHFGGPSDHDLRPPKNACLYYWRPDYWQRRD
ncbi:MAG TPA: ankyrin repeat domain-containing protein [Planctomycetota bacterium]